MIMAATKLKPRHRVALLAWFCEGLADAEIQERLLGTFKLELTIQAINVWRHKWAEEIDAAEAQATEAARREGWGKRSKRVRSLCRQLTKIDKDLEVFSVGQIAKFGMGREFRETLVELRKELGQDHPAKVELTGKDGHPLQTEQKVTVAHVLGNYAALEAAAALEEALADAGGADAGGVCSGG